MRIAEWRGAHQDAPSRPGGGGLHVGVLGSLKVRVDGRPVTVKTGRLRALVAVMAMSHGRAVAPERLAARIWGEELPGDGRRSVQLYVTRLRGLLGGRAIDTEPDGYVLKAHDVDALRFTDLLDDAAAAAEPAKERVLLGEALALWRGNPFEGLHASWLEQIEGPRLIDRYLAAMERRIDLDLAAGLDSAVVEDLRQLVNRHPLRERPWGQLMIALYRCGQQAEALSVYQRLYRLLADELGIAPSAAIQELHQRMLAGEQAPLPPATTSGHVPVPRQLPARVGRLAGRSTSLAQLHHALDRLDDEAPVAIVTGGAGVGKTTLTVHWAHEISPRFPDGQLYVDLRGFAPDGQAVRAETAIRGFLEAFGIVPAYVPTDLAAQVGLFRSLLAGKRVLIVLDNALDAEQVRPLLPGAPHSAAVVTSRQQMPELVAAGAEPVTLDVLSAAESTELLASRLGADVVEADPEVAGRIVDICAGLPLALAITAARANGLRRLSLPALAEELGQFHTSLDALASPDAATDIRGVFSWSYGRLSTPAKRLFRLLSILPSTGVHAAASLSGVPVPQVRQSLTELRRAHLLQEHLPGRYSCHDLLRTYAGELLHRHDTEEERQAAQRRVLDHYLSSAAHSALLIEPLRDPIPLPPLDPTVTAERFKSREESLAWFDVERSALLAAVTSAWVGRFDRHVWQLAWSLENYLQWQGRWPDRAATLRTALAAATRLGDRIEQARAHRCLGLAYAHLDDYVSAHAHLRDALTLYRDSDERMGQVHTHENLSTTLERQGDHDAALAHAQRALELFPPNGPRSSLGRLLNSAGWCLAQLGKLHEALATCERAVALAVEAKDQISEAATWDSLGFIRHRLGDHRDALAAYQRALEIRTAVGHREGAAGTLRRIGDTHYEAGQPAAAQASWRAAVTILDEIAQPVRL
ncbi:BTAD domain-containing putative transcriptional regulator [Asanoa sp. WMMD1127]|uniref:AfsR/SARP family transcriptional regulator n=1 Tax=Asanoa sp. WMMD1127 TaxID=3016107 RepID=UPI002416DC06|nr:BTAD domain-containing putative transcriptional regulator [Asanoa sp. WMMD1127]MDG4825100.1 BTAD domain-containing putative transcriptional regulator [Asanoa sp. WMMD1127]